MAIRCTLREGGLEIIYRAGELDLLQDAGDEPPRESHFCFIALSTGKAAGSAIVPFGKELEGSTVFLPFRADVLFCIRRIAGELEILRRVFGRTQWGAWTSAGEDIAVQLALGELRFRLPNDASKDRLVRVAVYTKSIGENDGWGRMIADPEFGIRGGFGDQAVLRFVEVSGATDTVSHTRSRFRPERVCIYQLLVRLFSNTNERRKYNGTMAENGVGKFRDINDAALTALRKFGFTHLWLTGVLRQASATAHPEIGILEEDPDLLKGLAGSPYAVTDCLDVSPDYAIVPARRLTEFRELIERVHQHELKAIIDFVPNHVARSYRANVIPELSFGGADDRTQFFAPGNHFYYLRPEDPGGGPPLRMPTLSNGVAVSATCKVLGTCDGFFTGEMDHGRVTGNNVVSWAPRLTDWYETVKLNYGYDFATGKRYFPHGPQPDLPIPDTWWKMDAVLAYWQALGVNGFRCDMSHMIPPEFWSWAISRARSRDPQVWFMAEAYDMDPARIVTGDPLLQSLNGGSGNVLFDLLNAGFDAVYDHPSYQVLKSLYDAGGWANDLDTRRAHAFIAQHSLNYAENHDEVRLAGQSHWGDLGPAVGRPVTAILFALGQGPVMIYHGQEVGEPAKGREGFSGDDAKTTIYDYWSMPELVKWVNGHRYDGGGLSEWQRDLRAYYRRLVELASEPAFREGDFYPLNPANIGNARFGRLAGETASGHWLYACFRSNGEQHFLIIVNLHPRTAMYNVEIRVPEEVATILDRLPSIPMQLVEQLSSGGQLRLPLDASTVRAGGFLFRELLPLTPYYFEIVEIPPASA